MSKKQKKKTKLKYREDLLRKRGIQLSSTRKKKKERKVNSVNAEALREEALAVARDSNPFIHLSGE